MEEYNMQKYGFGVDIGGTTIKVGFFVADDTKGDGCIEYVIFIENY